MKIKEFFSKIQVKITCAVIGGVCIAGLVLGGVSLSQINSGVEKLEQVVSTVNVQ